METILLFQKLLFDCFLAGSSLNSFHGLHLVSLNDLLRVFIFPWQRTLFFKDEDSLVVQLVKNSPAMQETPVRFLGQDDPLEKG